MNRRLEQTFEVQFQYPVHFTEGVFLPENPLLAQTMKPGDPGHHSARMLVVLDEGVASAHPYLVKAMEAYATAHEGIHLVRPPLIVPGGEQVKIGSRWVDVLLDAIDQYHIDRHAYLVGVGGGAVLDMAGYAAAIGHRGIRHIRIPTTVLSQNDSGVGVKNGVNRNGKKNFVGTFAPPFAVINDRSFLSTLEDRDWRAGTAEAVKVSLIRDGSFFTWLEDHALALAGRETAAMDELIYECARLHMAHIASGDPFEQGSSRPLDFGHWSAHKLEQISNYALRHGEAVAIGMALDAVYSQKRGMLSGEQLERIISLLAALGFELYTPWLEQRSSTGELMVLQGLEEFREHLGGKLTIMLLEGLGQGREVHEMDHATIIESIAYLKTVGEQTPA